MRTILVHSLFFLLVFSQGVRAQENTLVDASDKLSADIDATEDSIGPVSLSAVTNAITNAAKTDDSSITCSANVSGVNHSAELNKVLNPTSDPTSFPNPTDLTDIYNQVSSPEDIMTTSHSYADSAGNWCLESCSPIIKTATPLLEGMVAVMGQLKSSSQSCGKLVNIQNMASLALTTFNGACAYRKNRCKEKIKADQDTLTKAIADLDVKIKAVNVKIAAVTPAAAALTDELKSDVEYRKYLNTQVQNELKARMTTCSDYKWNEVAAIGGALSLVVTAAKTSQCKAALSQSTALDCTNSANYYNSTCVCQRSPNAVGCEGVSSANNTVASVRAASPATAEAVPSIVTPAALAASREQVPTSASGVSALGGAAATDAGASAAVKAVDAPKGVDAKSSLNTNVLGSEMGGGGSSSSKFSGGLGASSDDPSYNKYEKYLPGHSNDPNRKPASDTLKAQLGVSNGPSNFERVNSSYLLNTTTLTGY